MNAPKPYPRTPYLWRDDGREDNVIDPAAKSSWFGVPVVVEEKLDGANISLWLEAGTIQAATRGGADAMDRAGQLGRLRAWVAERDQQVRPLLSRFALYGEWLWLEHTVRYDRLPDWLTVLDLWSPTSGLQRTEVRNQLVREFGLLCPPQIFAGTLSDGDAVATLLGQSRWGAEPMEGVVIRRVKDDARCKVVRPGFTRKPDGVWAGTRQTNQRSVDDRLRQPPDR